MSKGLLQLTAASAAQVQLLNLPFPSPLLILDFRFPILDFRFPIPDSRFPTSFTHSHPTSYPIIPSSDPLPCNAGEG
jgi:hypothetical protein